MLSPFIFLTFAMVLLWWPDRQNKNAIARYAWFAAFVIAVMTGLYVGQLGFVTLLPMLLFAWVCYAFGRMSGWPRLFIGISVALLSLAMGMHLFPGFRNPLLVEQVQLSMDTIPYTLRFNFDKALIGLFILRWLHPRIRNWREVGVMIKRMLPLFIVSLIVVVLLSCFIGYVRFDPKLPEFIAYWIWANLFFTCVAEEALFRGFLQRQLGLIFGKVKHGAMLALLICAILFGLAHFGGGVKYVLLATVAGTGYGLVYYRTQRIEASILLHFMLNMIHILFFSYPALIQ